MRVCVKETYVEGVFVKGLCAAGIYVKELGVKQVCDSACMTCGKKGRAKTMETDSWQNHAKSCFGSMSSAARQTV